jgi:predicted transcriptional regulator
MQTWNYKDEHQKKAMEETVTTENCGIKLKLVRELSTMSRKDLARVLGCSESTIFASKQVTTRRLPRSSLPPSGSASDWTS